MLRAAMLVVLAIAGVAAAIVVGAYWTFDASMRDELNSLEAAAQPPAPITVTEQMLAGVPEPARWRGGDCRR